MKKLAVIIGLVALVGFITGGSALADPSLTLTVSDSGGGSQTFYYTSPPLINGFTYTGSSVFSATGSFWGTADTFKFSEDVSSISASSTVAGWVQLDLKYSGLTLDKSPFMGSFTATGNLLDGTATEDITINVGDTTVNSPTLTFSGPGMFPALSYTQSYVADFSGTFDAEEIVKINLGADTSVTSTDNSLGGHAPEPATLILWGTGLIGLGILGSRRKKA